MTEAPAASPAPKKPNVVWAIVAAFCPFAACPVTPVVTLAASGGTRGNPVELLHEGGPLAYGTLAIFVFACLALTVMAVFLARGARFPVTVLMFVSALPWLTGIAGMRVGMTRVMAALGNVEPSMKATLLAKGIAEASACRLLGTFLTAGLCAATALVLGLAAIANSEKPRSSGLLGALAAVPVLGACLLVPDYRSLGGVALVVVLPALAFVIAAVLGGIGLAGGARAAVLTGTLGIPATIAVVALARGVGVAGMIHLFNALASVAPDERNLIAAAGAAELASADKLAFVASVLGIVGALALAGFAFTRAERKQTVLIEAGLCAFIALLAAGADASALNVASKTMNEAAKEPWANVPGFQPLHAEGADSGDVWVLTPERLVAPNGDVIEAPLSADGLAKVTAKLTEQSDTSVRWEHGQRLRAWSVAPDRRIESAGLAKLISAARSAKMEQLVLVGRVSERPEVNTGSTWWLGLLGTTGGQPFWLGVPPEEGTSKKLKMLSAAELAEPSSSLVQPVLDPEQSSAQQLIDAAAKLQREGRVHPILANVRQLEQLEENGEVSDRPSRLDLLRARMNDPGRSRSEDEAVTADPADGRGREEVATLMRAHIREVQYCYEKRLKTNPHLGGKLIYQLTIEESGQTEAHLESSTMHDAEVEACVLSRLNALRFAAKPGIGETTVNYPFVFTPAN